MLEYDKYVGKMVKVNLHNGRFYYGKVTSFDELFLTLLDRYLGEKLISIAAIGEISLWKPKGGSK